MNLAFSETDLPVRLRFERPMTDAELLRFCEANEVLRVERDANGEILVMTPANSNTSKMNMRICRFLDEWTEADGRGVALIQAEDSHYLTGPCEILMQRGCFAEGGMRSHQRNSPASRRYVPIS